MTNIFSLLDSNTLDKVFVGADKMVKQLANAHDQFAKVVPGYPPYNIVKVDNDRYVIEMAVAGFGKNNLDIEIANNTLTVKGGLTLDQLDPPKETEYLYKGIADRVFTRKFVLADTVEVKNAELVNGMLKLWLENIIPDEKKPKKVNINDASESSSKTVING